MYLRDLPRYKDHAGIDETVRVYGDFRRLEIGMFSRIDAFTVITVGPKGIKIGRNVHIGMGCFISGAHGRVEIGDFCSLSPRSTIYAGADDMAADCLIGACAPAEHRKVITGDVTMLPGSAVGTNGIVFPGVTLGIGVVVGANSFVKGSVPNGYIIVGANEVAAGQTFGPRRNARRIQEIIDASC